MSIFKIRSALAAFRPVLRVLALSLLIPGLLSVVSPAWAQAHNWKPFQINWLADHTGWWLQAQTTSLGTGLGTNWFPVSGSAATNQIYLPVNPPTVPGSADWRDRSRLKTF